MAFPIVQKDIYHAAVVDTTNAIVKDFGDYYFSIHVDESRDISTKKQMAMALRYVYKNGHVIERFLDLKHVSSTTAFPLKVALEEILATHKLSISKMRGQGYDGASNMQVGFSGCGKKTLQVKALFEFVSRFLNTVVASCKRNDTLLAIQHDKILEELKSEQLFSGRRLNQGTTLQRAGDTRWGSHYATLTSLRHLYSSIIEVLEIVMEDGVNAPRLVEAGVLIDIIQSFDFIFSMHVMISILGFSNELSQALQRSDQNIDNTMRLVDISKQRLLRMRNKGWNSLLDNISSFCNKLGVDVPNMDDNYRARGR